MIFFPVANALVYQGCHVQSLCNSHISQCAPLLISSSNSECLLSVLDQPTISVTGLMSPGFSANASLTFPNREEFTGSLTPPKS